LQNAPQRIGAGKMFAGLNAREQSLLSFIHARLRFCGDALPPTVPALRTGEK
jgi:hypothetical protein